LKKHVELSLLFFVHANLFMNAAPITNTRPTAAFSGIGGSPTHATSGEAAMVAKTDQYNQ
jgi:hypothetical protein